MEVLDALQEKESDVKYLWITPPVTSFASDEDSGGDDSGYVDNLSGKQLQAPANAVFGDARVLGEEDDIEDKPVQDTLRTTRRTLKDSIKYKWTKVTQSLRQIPPDPRLQPSVYLNGVFDHLTKDTNRYAALSNPRLLVSIEETKQVI